MAKANLNKIELLISKPLLDSNISPDEFSLANYVLNQYDVMKEEIKNFNKLRRIQFIRDFILFIDWCYRIVRSVEKNRKSKNPKFVKTNLF